MTNSQMTVAVARCVLVVVIRIARSVAAAAPVLLGAKTPPRGVKP